MNAEERMTKGQLEEEIQYFRKIFQEIRLFPIGNISDIDEEWRKINEGQSCYHYWKRETPCAPPDPFPEYKVPICVLPKNAISFFSFKGSIWFAFLSRTIDSSAIFLAIFFLSIFYPLLFSHFLPNLTAGLL